MKKTKKSLVIQIVAACLIMASVVGIAYAGFMRSYKHDFDLTITVGRIDLSMTKATEDMIVPGTVVELTAAPAVTVGGDNQPCWLFIEIEKTPHFNSYLSYDDTVAEGWTLLNGMDNVYYRQLDRLAQDTTFVIMEDTSLEISASLTDKQLSKAADQSIAITAYAVQHTDDTNSAVLAWAQIRP